MGERPYAGAVIAGVGLTDLSRDSGRTVLQLATEACRSAAADAGVDPRTIDGIVTYQYLGDSVPAQAVASALGLPELRHSLDSGLAGQAPCALVSHAALVVSAGIADTVVVFRALNGRSGQRVGRARAPGKPAELRASVGLTAYAQVIALWAQRFLHDTGQGPEDLAAVAVAQRRWAERNERAARRSPLDLDAYFDSPFVAEPLRGVDCTVEVDGACAVLVTRADRVADLPHRPVHIASAAYAAGHGVGLDMADLLTWPDLSRNYTSYLAEQLWDDAGLGPDDIDVAELYDCFSSTVLFALEGLGFAGRGESGDFVREGSLPINTNGGLLCEGYLHGMNTVAEAVFQLQGRGGDRQVAGAEVVAVTSGALQDGSAMVLTGG